MLRIEGKPSKVGPHFTVIRTLPDRQKRMVGPFTFLDHMGPLQVEPFQSLDIAPHPHIGLSTLTYLYEGRSVHRDSLGTLIDVLPGDVNLMTAGRGVVHSERERPEDQNRIRPYHGLQFWLALPDALEDCEPKFTHYDKNQIPQVADSRSQVRVVVGEAFGVRSPVILPTVTTFLDVKISKAQSWSFLKASQELALYVIAGQVVCKGEIIEKNQMLVFQENEVIDLEILSTAHFIVIGGMPCLGRKHIWWNFVSSSRDKIERAKQAWQERQFPEVPGETEFVPLPEPKSP